MANKKTLPSDPEFLLQYLDDMDSDFSDEDFDGYVEENNEGCETQAGETEAMEVEEMEQEIVEDQELEDFGIEETEEDDSPIIPPFHQNTGVTRDMNDLQPVDFFFELFPQDLLTYIVQESNRYGQQYLMNHAAYLEEHPRARANQFKRKPIVEDEIKKFIALVIGMGIVNMPDMQQYWSTSWPFTSTNFSSIMSRDRFLLLLKFLHLANNTRMAAKGQRGYDTLFKVRHLLTTLIARYKDSYRMKKEVSVDESIIAYKGRLSFLQYMPKKPHKWGMKAWVLAEAETGYTWNFHLYTGKEEARPAGLPLGTHVVIDLVKDLAGKGHHIYFDNFYTSPQLCKALLTRGFGSCGTVRLDRKEIPDSFKRTVVQTGEVAYYKDGHVLGLKWKDKRVVSLLTTIHDESMVTKSRRMKGAPNGIQVIDKPYGIDEYNKYMGGVDKAGQLVQYYGYNNFSKKWWKRVFFHIIAVAEGLLAQTDTTFPATPSIAADTPARLLGHNHFPEPSGGRHDCKTPYTTSALTPYTTSTLTPYTTSTLAPYATSTLTPYTTSTLTPYTTSTLTPYTTSTLTPYTTSTLAPYTTSMLTPYATSTLTPYATSTLTPYTTSTLTPYATSTLTPYTTSTLAPYTTRTLTPSTTSTQTPYTTSTLTPYTTSTLTPYATSTLTPYTTNTLTPYTKSMQTPYTTSALTPYTTSTLAPYTTSTLTPYTTSTLTPYTTSTLAPHTTSTLTRYATSTLTPCATSMLQKSTSTLTPYTTSILTRYATSTLTPFPTGMLTPHTTSMLNPYTTSLTTQVCSYCNTTKTRTPYNTYNP
ncbi:hypothetical protein EMCRGX_G005473 [Ephydatia muelleri]